jgi:hypothetical protein
MISLSVSMVTFLYTGCMGAKKDAATRLMDALEEHASKLPVLERTARLNAFQEALTEAASKHRPKVHGDGVCNLAANKGWGKGARCARSAPYSFPISIFNSPAS